METILPSDILDAFEKAVREQGKAFRVPSLFEALPPLDDFNFEPTSQKNAKTSDSESLEEEETKELRSFGNIPAEIVLRIFPHLTRVSSICLGLTCKSFYAIHRSFIPEPIHLHEHDRIYHCNLVPLYQLLKKWKSPNLVSVHPTKDRCFFVKKKLVEAWLRKGVGMEGFLGIKRWE